MCSLASRLNTSDSLQKAGGSSFTSAAPCAPAQIDEPGSQPEYNLCQAGSYGIEAIASSQSETYNFYAKTAPRDIDDGSYVFNSYNKLMSIGLQFHNIILPYCSVNLQTT